MAHTSCFWIQFNKVYSADGAFLCGSPNINGHTSCCTQGDTCHPEGFCHFIHPQEHASGWYLSGCTDPLWQDPSCPQSCQSFARADVIFNQTTDLWACCGNPASGTNVADCSQPADITFEAPEPQVLLNEGYSIPNSLSPTSSTTQLAGSQLVSTSTSTPSISTSLALTNHSATAGASPSSMPQISGSSSLSIAAKAGIGTLAAVIGVMLLGLLGLLILRRQRFTKQIPVPVPVTIHKKHNYGVIDPNTVDSSLSHFNRYEIGEGQRSPIEMEDQGKRKVTELKG